MRRIVKRLYYYFMLVASFVSRAFRNRNVTMSLAICAYKSQGVSFTGMPRYIHPNAYLDASGGLYIGERVVISTRVIVLTHDYSINVGIAQISDSLNKDTGLLSSVNIGDWSFLGAGCIILPGTTIGKYCVIGAGAVVKGDIPDYSIVVGNPAKIIKTTDRWKESLCRSTKNNIRFFQDEI
jgi:acetyltransferase-like isoleucine patch superfamily enzyme